MARIFNTIRQRLLAQNRFTRYLIYAIGEIILVVIGILIALQLNTWKSEHADAQQVQFYLVDLREDLTQDKIELEGMIAGNIQRIAAIQKIFEHISAGSGSEALKELKDLHLLLYSESFYVPNLRTIDQVRSTGHGVLIKNTELRKKLFAYYARCERVERNGEVSVQMYQHHQVSPALSRFLVTQEVVKANRNLDLDLPPTDMAVIGKDQQYIAALFLKEAMSENQNKQYYDLLSRIQEILELMEQEINTTNSSKN